MVSLTQQKENSFGTDYTLTSSTFFDLIKATISKEFTIFKRYKANMIGGFVEVTIIVLVFWLIASITSFRAVTLNQDQRFIFYYIAILFILFSNSALWKPLRTIRQDLYNGTLEYFYSTNASRYGYFIGVIVADILFRLIYLIPMLIILYFMIDVTIIFLIQGLAVILLAVTILIGVGVIISTAAIKWKEVSAIAGILNMLFDFFAGAYFPLISLPKVVQYFALLLPHTYLYDLLRYYSLDGKWPTLLPVYLEWIIISIYFIGLVLLTRFLVKLVEKHAKEEGLHLI